MKKNKIKFLISSLIPIVILPTMTIVSCSKSNDSDPIGNKIAPRISVAINTDNILQTTSKSNISEITIGDIFTSNCKTLDIKLDKELEKWNSNADKSKKVDVDLEYVELPMFPSNSNKIDKLTVFLNVTAGRNGSKVIKKELLLNEINNVVDINNLNVFSNNNINELYNNNVWFQIQEKTKHQLQGINVTDSENDVVNKLNSITIENEGQKLYACLERIESNGILLNLYTNDERIENATLDILANGGAENKTNRCIVLQMFFTFSEINSGGNGV